MERLQLNRNGLVEAHSEGAMCWHDDYEELQRQLAEVTAERDKLQILLAAADTLRNAERGMIVTGATDADVVALRLKK